MKQHVISMACLLLPRSLQGKVNRAPLPLRLSELVLDGGKIMLKKKSIGVALACALALGAWSGATLATPIDVNGVHWDSSSPFDLTVQSLNLPIGRRRVRNEVVSTCRSRWSPYHEKKKR